MPDRQDTGQSRYGCHCLLPKDEPNAGARMLDRVIDDQGRDVEYDFTMQGVLREVRSDRSYSGGNLESQVVTGRTGSGGG